MQIILRIYNKEELISWNRCVKSYAQWDIYNLCEYACSFMMHGDGEPMLIHYMDDTASVCYVAMKKKLADCQLFQGRLDGEALYDLETPYGYGGPLTDRCVPAQSQRQFLRELTEYCKEQKIVAQFVRFNPLTGNHTVLPEMIETRYMRDTIYIDTSETELIWKNMDSKNRNMVRKAKKSGITIERCQIEEYARFMPIYEETMEKKQAEKYYRFGKDYFSYLQNMKEYVSLFFAMLDGKTIGGAIMYHNERNMHYHLAGTCSEYRQYASGNLLLYEAAVWCAENGIRKFHLGGGMSEDDSLFGFKKQFNKCGRIPFYVGRTIFDRKEYDRLRQLRKEIDGKYDPDNRFMIQYRA